MIKCRAEARFEVKIGRYFHLFLAKSLKNNINVKYHGVVIDLVLGHLLTLDVHGRVAHVATVTTVKQKTTNITIFH